jgi:hypothetical protein
LKNDEKCALNIRGFPLNLRKKCKIKAAMEDETLEQFVQRVLREATKDTPDPKSKPKRS